MSQSLAGKIVAANAMLIVNGDPTRITEFFTSDYVVHLTDKDVTGGHGAIRRLLRAYQRAFSDIRVEVEILVTARDRVAWQRTIWATHIGRFKGFPAAGRAIVWREMVTSRFRDGLIAEDWLVSDLAEHLLPAKKR